MNDQPPASEGQAPPTTPPRRARRWKRVVAVVGALLLLYLAVAYVLMPALWVRYAHRHPAFDDLPRITRTGDDLPGDPLNVALVGTEPELKKVMRAAKWFPA